MTEAVTDRLSRRDIVAALAGTMALSACGGSMGGSSSNLLTLGAPVTTSATAEVAMWTSLKGTAFGAGGYGLTLLDVAAQDTFGDRPANVRRQPFVAAFEVTQGGAMAGDQTYRMTSAAANPLEVYLTASPTVPGRMYALFD